MKEKRKFKIVHYQVLPPQGVLNAASMDPTKGSILSLVGYLINQGGPPQIKEEDIVEFVKNPQEHDGWKLEISKRQPFDEATHKTVFYHNSLFEALSHFYTHFNLDTDVDLFITKEELPFLVVKSKISGEAAIYGEVTERKCILIINGEVTPVD